MLVARSARPGHGVRGLRERGLRKTTDGGETWRDVELPERGCLLGRGQPGRRRRLRRLRAEPALSQRRRRRPLARWTRSWTCRRADVALPAAAVDVARPLDRAEPARRRAAARRDRARRADALDRRRRVLGRPPPGRAARRALGRLAPARARPRVRGGRRRRGVQRRRGESWTPADEGRDRDYTWAVATDPADPNRWWVSASTGPFAAHGGRDSQARIYRSTAARGKAVTDELAAMPYALAVADGRVFAGLCDGALLETRDGGDSWQRLDERSPSRPRLDRRLATPSRARARAAAPPRRCAPRRSRPRSSSAGLPECGSSRTASFVTTRGPRRRRAPRAPPRRARPRARWSSTVTIGSWSERSVSASIGLTE